MNQSSVTPASMEFTVAGHVLTFRELTVNDWAEIDKRIHADRVQMARQFYADEPMDLRHKAVATAIESEITASQRNSHIYFSVPGSVHVVYLSAKHGQPNITEADIMEYVQQEPDTMPDIVFFATGIKLEHAAGDAKNGDGAKTAE